MTRTITGDMVTEFTAEKLRPVALVKFAFDSGDLDVWTGIGDVSFAGDTYSGVGDLGSISTVAESSALEANDVEFTLTGIPASFISTALSESYQGRLVKLWVGAIDSSSALISDPVLMYTGRMDVMIILESGDQSTITVRSESILRALDRPSARKYTSEDQKSEFPGDRAFDNITLIQSKEFFWGS